MASDSQGYHYGLRMLNAFTRVVRMCYQANDDITSEKANEHATMSQKEQAESLQQLHRILMHRCRCHACLHLKHMNKSHLASLPLWLCQDYATGDKLMIDKLPSVIKERKEELLHLFSHVSCVKPENVEGRRKHTCSLYKAPLFCFWPQCQNYEMERIEIKNHPKIYDLENEGLEIKDLAQKLRSFVQQKLRDKQKLRNERKYGDRFEFIISICCDCEELPKNPDNDEELKQAISNAKVFTVVIMRSSHDGHHDLRWVKKNVHGKFVVNMLPNLPVGEDIISIFNGKKTTDEDSIRAKIGIVNSEDNQQWKFSTQDEDVNYVNKQFELQNEFSASEIAVACIQSHEMWMIDRFSFLLRLLKRLEDDFGTGDQADPTVDDNSNFTKTVAIDESFFEETVANVVHKFNFQKSPPELKATKKMDISIFRRAFDCTQYLRDQSISFMTDLGPAFKGIEHHRDRERYEAYRDTIAQFMNRIKIVETDTRNIETSKNEQAESNLAIAATCEMSKSQEVDSKKIETKDQQSSDASNKPNTAASCDTSKSKVDIGIESAILHRYN